MGVGRDLLGRLSDPKSGPIAELSPQRRSVFREGCLLGREISRRPQWLSTMQGPHRGFGDCRGLDLQPQATQLVKGGART